MDVEKEIEELKELVKENIEVTEETNRMVRKLRRSALWAWLFQIIWWLAIAGVSGAAYYYYVQPYVAKIEQLYGLSEEQSKSWNDQVTNFLKFFDQTQSQHGGSSTSATHPVPVPTSSTSTSSSTPR